MSGKQLDLLEVCLDSIQNQSGCDVFQWRVPAGMILQPSFDSKKKGNLKQKKNMFFRTNCKTNLQIQFRCNYAKSLEVKKEVS